MNIRKYLPIAILCLTILGILDSVYLTKAHYSNFIPPCTNSIFVDCGKVLRSQYSVVFGFPLAFLGLIHYVLFTSFILLSILTSKKIFRYFILVQSAVGLFVSFYLTYLQFFV